MPCLRPREDVVNKRLAWIGIGLSALVSTSVMAAGYDYGPGPSYGGFYFGASAGEVLYNEEGIPQLTPTVAIFRVGQQFNPYLAIEGRIGGSVSADHSARLGRDIARVWRG